jgi:hypothetical protein
MIRVPSGQVENPQQLTAVVAGPDGANRLFILDGQLQVGLGGNGPVKETFSVLLGPVLTRRQFVQATGTASLTGFGFNNVVANSFVIWSINSVDADWDDESGQVEMRIEVSASSNGTGIQVNKLGYHVTILAEIAPTPLP